MLNLQQERNGGLTHVDKEACGREASGKMAFGKEEQDEPFFPADSVSRLAVRLANGSLAGDSQAAISFTPPAAYDR